MSRVPARAQAGFTFLEMVIVVSLFSLIVTTFGSVFSTSSNLSAETRARMWAEDDNRRSLDAIANDLRSAAWASLKGFDGSGSATSVTFQPVLHAASPGVVLDEEETMCWEATSAKVNGVSSPGRVCCKKASGETEVMAPRVPSGGLTMTLLGNTLRIQLTSFYSTSQRRVSTVTSEVELSFRN
jgi:prepilin-type N-terminal cleavage/methylation domain-containing protein